MALMFCAVTYHLRGNNKTNMALMFCAVTYHLRGVVIINQHGSYVLCCYLPLTGSNNKTNMTLMFCAVTYHLRVVIIKPT